MDISSLKDRLVQSGQAHLVKFWDRLNNEEQSVLYKDLDNIDYEAVNLYYERCMASLRNVDEKLDDCLEPLPKELCGSVTRCSADTLNKYRDLGLRQVSEGKVAVLLLAGGQGTRLGVNYPKGMYDVGLPSQKTLYQLQAERILKLQELAQQLTGVEGHIPWYIMTSESTREPTRAFFKKNNYFGLLKENVVLFEQHTLPCLTLDGKIILENMHKVARAPDGNGGLYRALGTSDVIEDMDRRGIQSVHVYCVDNILVKMADPVFIGFCLDKGAVCGAKVVQKSSPNEAVGVVCKVAGHYKVVEYSEITSKTAERRNSDGSLTFNAGNICNHFFTVDFLKSIVREHDNDLIHHVAKKKINHVDEKGMTVKPSVPNGIKMEKFVFDVFAFSNNLAVWEVVREDEFSPLKNSDDAPKDTPTTSRQSLYGLHRHLVEHAGGRFINADGSTITNIQSDDIVKRRKSNGVDHCNGPTVNGSNDEQEEDTVVEISPLVSYAGEGLEALVKDKLFVAPLTISRDPKGQVQILSQNSSN